MRNFIIDTDTASDDAVALVMALRQPDIDVKAITVVAGNVPLDMGVQNALYTVELCGADTPVYAGRAKPLLRELETAQDVHGRDGMGDIGLPLHGREPAVGTRRRQAARDNQCECRRHHPGHAGSFDQCRARFAAGARIRAACLALLYHGRHWLGTWQRDADGGIQYLGRSGGGKDRFRFRHGHNDGGLGYFLEVCYF